MRAEGAFVGAAGSARGADFRGSGEVGDVVGAGLAVGGDGVTDDAREGRRNHPAFVTLAEASEGWVLAAAWGLGSAFVSGGATRFAGALVGAAGSARRACFLGSGEVAGLVGVGFAGVVTEAAGSVRDMGSGRLVPAAFAAG